MGTGAHGVRSGPPIALLTIMDNIGIILLAVLILVMLIGWPIARPFLKRRANAAGREAGEKYAAGKLPGVLEALGRTVVIHADEAAAHHVVDAAVATMPRKAGAHVGGGWAIKWVEKDDVVAQLTTEPSSGASVLSVSRFRDYLGFPQGAKEWTAFARAVEQAAAASGIAVSTGSVTFARGARVDDKNWVWAPVAGHPSV